MAVENVRVDCSGVCGGIFWVFCQRKMSGECSDPPGELFGEVSKRNVPGNVRRNRLEKIPEECPGEMSEGNFRGVFWAYSPRDFSRPG